MLAAISIAGLGAGAELLIGLRRICYRVCLRNDDSCGMKRVILVLTFAFTLALSAPSLCAIGGVPLWTNIYTEPNNGFDVPAAIAVDGNGNVIVTGSSPGGSGTTMDYATVAYSNAGSPLWTNRLDWLGGSSEAAEAVVTDAAGHVIVTGSALEPVMHFD